MWCGWSEGAAAQRQAPLSAALLGVCHWFPSFSTCGQVPAFFLAVETGQDRSSKPTWKWAYTEGFSVIFKESKLWLEKHRSEGVA